MKNLKYLLSAIFVVGALSGCSSQWNQDPLAEKDAALRDGQSKPTNPEKPKPIDNKNVLVDPLSETYTFREGTMGEYGFTVRILENDYVPTVSVENLADFPGAVLTLVSYDQPTRMATLKLTWTPPLGTVSGDSGSLEDAKVLKLLVIGNKPNAKVISGHPTLGFKVGKVLSAPEIFSISKSSANMREGESLTVTIKVRDKDAGNDVKSYPNLQILPITGYANLSQFVTITQVLARGNKEFEINLTIDLLDAELTKSRDNFGFTLKAVSRFQQASVGQDIFVNVFTSFADIQTTWFDVIEVPLGVKKDYQFMMFDPKDELFIGTPTFSGLPSGATINCSGLNVARQFCTFAWTPDFTVAPGDYTVQAQLAARNQDARDNFIKNVTFNLKLRVTEAPPVSPLVLQGGK